MSVEAASPDLPPLGFDRWGPPAVTIASVILITVAVVLFSFPPVGLVNLEPPETSTTLLNYTISDEERADRYDFTLFLMSNGTIAVGSPLSAINLDLDGRLRLAYPNSSATLEGWVTGEDADGVISFSWSRFWGGEVFFPDFPENVTIVLSELIGQFRSSGSIVFQSTGEKGLAANFTLSVSSPDNDTIIQGSDIALVQVSESQSPVIERVGFYGAAIALLATGLALPGWSRNLRELWDGHRTDMRFTSRADKAIVIGLILGPIAVGSLILLTLPSGSPYSTVIWILLGASVLFFGVLYGLFQIRST